MGQIVKPASLHVQTYQILKKSIMNGERKPSERVVEAKVASTLGISRGPVREAIRMLIQDGLLVYNDGFVKVYHPTKQDTVEIFACRESLEMLAIRLAIEQTDDHFLEQLRSNINQTREVLDQPTELKQLDQSFHTMINLASKNNHLIQLLSVINTKIHYMRNSMETSFYPTLLEEHERIFQSINEKDVKKATQLIQIHIQKGLNSILHRMNFS